MEDAAFGRDEERFCLNSPVNWENETLIRSQCLEGCELSVDTYIQGWYSCKCKIGDTPGLELEYKMFEDYDQLKSKQLIQNGINGVKNRDLDLLNRSIVFEIASNECWSN